MTKTSDRRILETLKIVTPREVIEEFPSTPSIDQLVTKTRDDISQILHGRDQRLLVVVGPCSIHDVDAAMEYGQKLVHLREKLSDKLEIVMRVYFEKPRTTVGWKGLINDPDLDGSFQVSKGLRLARQLLLDLNQIGMPAGTEFLDIVTGQYYADLISWGAIGARTTESQVHREMASGLSCPVGFKNGTDGNIKIAIDAIKSANNQHIFLSPTQGGTTAIYKTSGNDDAHIILRGGKTPNYYSESVQECSRKLDEEKIKSGLMIDFSHANSLKQFAKQIEVGEDVAAQIESGQKKIAGVMIESHLIEDRQDVVKGKPLTYGQSITDACLGWDATEVLLHRLADAVQA
ncbi:3-deoxy-7-phosphoheptulonate synthase [Aliikangiella coralliicola]|uniref:Phospho-2-dehydro-3-deoxyheptonate aldolase n=1 Tax=Aliikangiella coralliicola TaxID=2592383 RepID=A0A545UED7_9GAMM|nr:3-deoxy-7-phosphoheptulonate synthase [Aliikangiella coralliicola]TQV87795.1 3-deoxy-7-phosphoheptulonate synthase [Aliikangiella coralliicola]